MNSFDQRAKTWDSNPIHLNRAIAIAEKIKQQIPLNSISSALEYGAGTGDLSFLLKDSIKHIITMDSSVEMVRVASQKLEEMQIKNVQPICYDLELQNYSSQLFDFVYMQMVLHHILDIKLFLSKCYSLIQPRGYLAIADLYKEDGTFHGEGFNGHFGFDTAELYLLIENLGFKNIRHEQCYVMERELDNALTKKYPMFLLIATK